MFRQTKIFLPLKNFLLIIFIPRQKIRQILSHCLETFFFLLLKIQVLLCLCGLAQKISITAPFHVFDFLLALTELLL